MHPNWAGSEVGSEVCAKNRSSRLHFGRQIPDSTPVAIPHFEGTGFLPEGLHDCTLEEVATRFAAFQRSDRRPRLWALFTAFVRECKVTGLVELVLLDGSFVTSTDEPNDIDVVVVVFATHDFGADLAPQQYNVSAPSPAAFWIGYCRRKKRN